MSTDTTLSAALSCVSSPVHRFTAHAREPPLPGWRFGAVPLTATGILIHMFCVGLPIALAARIAL